MQLLTAPRISQNDKCPYIEGNEERHEFFFADDIKYDEMDFLLSKGWRKFGQFLFRPKCETCNKCRPLRVPTKDYKNSKSNRRTIKSNQDIQVIFSPIEYKREHFYLYMKHSKERFEEKQIDNENDFTQSFFAYTGTQIMSEFYLENKLVAFGILDRGNNSLSSVYFVFDPQYSKRSLGVFGALKEIEYAQKQSLDYYYLGYWIKENRSMNYKAHYRPHELYDWDDKQWSLNDLSEG
jgi:arginyl-tRNA--protein-N-Asp/Glu arginylyltransferase